MRRTFLALLAAATTIASAPAAAQTTPAEAPEQNAAAEALGRCLVLKSTGADRIAVARWLMIALASAPQVADAVTLKPGQREAADKALAVLFTRLLAVDCASESKVLFATRSKSGFEVAGEALGRVAIGELLTNREANEALGGYTRYLDENAFKAILPAPAPKK